MTATTTLRDDFLAALLAADSTRARSLVERAVERGRSVADVYLHVLQPALEEVGELWAAGELSIAYEHYASSVTQGIMGALGPRIRIAPRGGRLAVLACAPGERHTLGLEMVGDFLESAAWEVLPLGASVPAQDLASLVEAEQPDLVGLSAALPGALEATADAIAAIRGVTAAPFVVVGGRAWHRPGSADPESLGADACILEPGELVRVVSERFPPLADGEG